VETVREVQVADARTTYYAELAKEVADWQTINNDPKFEAWLDGIEPLTGLKRAAILGDAFQAMDHRRTVAIFKSFQQETGASAPAVPTPPEPPKEDLMAEVSPGNSRAVTEPSLETDKKVWTTAEMSEFYTGVTRGDYRGREAEAKRIEAEIDAALIAGRVR
jgi:hypothetical protein